MRRGESLGLRWSDINFETDTFQIRQQLLRVQGRLILGPVKTRAGQRDLPLLDLARQALTNQAAQQASYQRPRPYQDQHHPGDLNVDADARRDALTRLHGLLDETQS
jgi:integrase